MSGIKRTRGNGKRSVDAITTAMSADDIALVALRERTDNGTALLRSSPSPPSCSSSSERCADDAEPDEAVDEAEAARAAPTR